MGILLLSFRCQLKTLCNVKAFNNITLHVCLICIYTHTYIHRCVYITFSRLVYAYYSLELLVIMCKNKGRRSKSFLVSSFIVF